MNDPTLQPAPVPEQPPLPWRRRARTPEPMMRALAANEWARLGFTRDGAPITLEQAATHLQICLVCGGRPELIGCFIPHAAHVPALLDVTEPLFGPVQPGTQRIGVYALCQPCGRAPTTLAAVEARFLGEPGT
jgi:hypothetical protein